MKYLPLLSIMLFVCSCTQEVDQDSILKPGLLSCTSPKSHDIEFHTRDVKTATLLGVSDLYVTVKINEAEIKLFESEGWICTHENGTTEAFFQRG